MRLYVENRLRFQVVYPSKTREEELRRYFLDEVAASDLARDLQGSVVHVDNLSSIVQIADMRTTFMLTRQHVVKLCDAFQDRTLGPEGFSTIAFALLASDTFEWDDDVISEVLSDWSAPEINFELNDQTMTMHRSWLLGTSEPPHRSMVESSESGTRLISMRRKTTY